jgi:PAS domain-containing protein
MEPVEHKTSADISTLHYSAKPGHGYISRINDIPLAALLVDGDGMIIDASPSFCAISGYGSVFHLLRRPLGVSFCTVPPEKHCGVCCAYPS